jgi:hypothetical protein
MLEQADVQKRSISVRTARRWLHHLDWRYGRRKNGMYVDGHERNDVVAYRKAFVKRWLEEYEPRMLEYDNDGNPKKEPNEYVLQGRYKGQLFKLILVTHDESTFYANDRHKDGWISKTGKNKPQQKGEGESIMVSDFLTLEWGRLTNGDQLSSSHFVQTFADSMTISEKQDSFSVQGKTEMDISHPKTYSLRSIKQFTCSKQKPMVGLQACFCLIMLQAIANELIMHSLPVTWSKTPNSRQELE